MVHGVIGGETGFVGEAEEVGGADESTFIVSKGASAEAAVEVGVVADATGGGIKEGGALPIEHGAGFVKIGGVTVDLIEQGGGDGARAVDAGVFGSVGGFPPEAAAHVGGPGASVAEVEIGFGEVAKEGVACQLVSAAAGDDHPHDVVVEVVRAPIAAMIGNEAVEDV